MKKSTIGALLIFLLGAVAISSYKYFEPRLRQQDRIKTSDAKDVKTIRIGGDSYLGYWFIQSPEMRRQLARSGLAVSFVDDQGSYADRLQKFSSREYDAIVLPINSYLQHGAAYDYPGVIVAAISESKGADGIVGFADRFESDKVEDLNDPGLRIVYTKESPSSFLLDLTIVDFDLANLSASDSWRQETEGANIVLERARKKQGDAFVLWEPELSRALNEVPGLKYIWGSDKFGGYIVDVFVFHRDFLRRNEAEVMAFLESYFLVLRTYGNNYELLLEDLKKTTGLKGETAEQMLQKIDWFDLQENANKEFGISTGIGELAREGLVNSIIACTDVMIRSGKLHKDPLAGNPYQIVNSSLIKSLLDRFPAAVGKRQGEKHEFRQLGEDVWKKLREVGTMRVEPIAFQAGGAVLDDLGKIQIDKIASILNNNYPDYRVAVRGHTGPGDEEQNLILSRQRADAVVQRLIAVHGFSAARLSAQGRGSAEPPVRKPGEGERAYRYRLPRVEFVLLEENKL